MSEPKRTVRQVLAGRDYRRLWVARTVSQWGDTFNVVALALLVYQLTRSGVGVSGLVLAEIAPVLLLAPLVGPLVDRLPRAQVMIGADLARMVLAALLAVWHGHLAAVYAAAFGFSAGAVFFNPAAGSVLPTLLAGDQDLVPANTGIWTTAVLSQIVLAPLAGLLTTAVGFGAAFAINALSFAASAAVLTRLRPPKAPAPVPRQRLFAEALAGARLIVTDALLRALAVGQVLAAPSAGATSALLVVLARRQLHVGATGYGLLLAAIGIGAAAGPLVVLPRVHQPRRPALVFVPFALRGGVDLVLASFSALPAALAALAAYGVGTSTGTVTFNSLIQAETPPHTRGRVFAAMDLLWQTGRLISLGVGGWLADAAGIRAVYYLGGALLLAAALVGTTAARSARA